MADIWDKIQPGDVKAGDHIKTVATFHSGTTVTHEGAVEYVIKEPGTTYAQLAGVPYVPWTQEELDVLDTIDIFRLRPQLKLPTRYGSAILVHDVNYLRDVVLVLQPAPEYWVNAGDAPRGWDLSEIEHHFVRVLFDAGA